MSDEQSSLNTWLERFRSALDVLSRAGNAICGPPAGEPGAERLRLILSIRARLSVDDALSRPGRTAGERLASAACGESNKAYLGEIVEATVHQMDAEITKCLAVVDAATVHKCGLIRSRDFGPEGVVTLAFSPQPGRNLIVAGLINRLAPDHPLRAVLNNPDDLYQTVPHSQPRQPALLLGPPEAMLSGPSRPRPWYGLSSALRLTESYRTVQLAAEFEGKERARLERLRDEEERLARESSPEVQLTKLQRQVAELEQRLNEPKSSEPASKPARQRKT